MHFLIYIQKWGVALKGLKTLKKTSSRRLCDVHVLILRKNLMKLLIFTPEKQHWQVSINYFNLNINRNTMRKEQNVSKADWPVRDSPSCLFHLWTTGAPYNFKSFYFYTVKLTDRMLNTTFNYYYVFLRKAWCLTAVWIVITLTWNNMSWNPPPPAPEVVGLHSCDIAACDLVEFKTQDRILAL